MRRLLLVDTHILVWTRICPERLSADERDALIHADTRAVSAVTLWEIALLMAKERLPSDDRLLDVPEGFELLPVEPAHCRALASLPSLHRDPFDRMLVAQAQCEGLALLTRDAVLVGYGRAGAPVLLLGP